MAFCTYELQRVSKCKQNHKASSNVVNFELGTTLSDSSVHA